MRVACIALALASGACTKTNTIVCGDTTCAPGSTCTQDGRCIPPGCGDGTVGTLEQCDPMATPMRCVDFGYYGVASVGCTETCELDYTDCLGTCGDHAINGPESCDGIPPAGESCADYGFDVGKLACTSACSPSFALCSTIGWSGSPGGAATEITSIWGGTINGNNVGYAVGRGGTMLRAVDGVWVEMPSPTTADLFAIAGTSEGVVAVGAGGIVLRLRFSTGAWAQTTAPTNGKDLYAVSGDGPSNIIAVGDGGTIVKFDGTSWATQNSGTTAALRSVWTGTATSFIVGDNGTLLRNGIGGSWTTIDPASVFGAMPYPDLGGVFAADTEVYVVGSRRTVKRFSTGSWTDLPLPASVPADATFHTVWASSSTDVFVAGEFGRIFHWDGYRVVEHTTPTSRSILTLHGIDSARSLAATSGGQLLEYNGLALHYETPAAAGLTATTMVGNVTWAVGDAGTVLRHDRTGWTVEPGTIPNAPPLSSIWVGGSDIYLGSASPADGGIFLKPQGATDFTSVSATRVHALYGLASPTRIVGVGQYVAEYTAATGWTQRQLLPTTSLALHGIWASPDGHWFAVGDEGYAYHKTPTADWTEVATPATGRLTAVWGTASSDVYAVGDFGTIIHWDGVRWRRMYTGSGDNFTAIHGTHRGDIYAVGSNGLAFHYDGISWARMSPPALDLAGVWSDGARTVMVGGSPLDVVRVAWLERAIGSKETRCEDPWDNDGKDGTNCDDPNCRLALACVRGGACETLDRVSCETRDEPLTSYSGIARIDNLPCLDEPTPGPEASYRFVADRSGSVTVTVRETVSDSTSGPVLQLVVVDGSADGACQLASCRAATRVDATTLSITFDVTNGRAYYIVVDGPVYQAADFTMSLDCPAL